MLEALTAAATNNSMVISDECIPKKMLSEHPLYRGVAETEHAYRSKAKQGQHTSIVVHVSSLAATGLCRPRLAWLAGADTEHRWHWCWQHIALSLHSAHLTFETKPAAQGQPASSPWQHIGLRLSPAHLLRQSVRLLNEYWIATEASATLCLPQ